MVKMFWMIVGAISVPLVYGFLRTKKFYDGVLIVAPGYTKEILFMKPPLPPGASARREKSETRRLPPPHSDLNRRPADFWREAISRPFHHGTLLAKIRRTGFSTASGPQSITLEILRK